MITKSLVTRFPHQTFAVRVRGPIGLFTQPALKVERVSYPVITPSAARGLVESILWKPAISWQIDRIRVLNPIRFITFRRNEVNTKAVAPSASIITYGGPSPQFFADQDRTQRNTVALRDVDYVIEAHFIITDRAGPDDNPSKFTEMFLRRVEKGQHWAQPYLGCREFAAEVLQADGAPKPIQESRDLGWMLRDIEYGPNGNHPMFFQARLEDGVLHVPPPVGGAPSAGPSGGGA